MFALYYLQNKLEITAIHTSLLNNSLHKSDLFCNLLLSLPLIAQFVINIFIIIISFSIAH